MAHGRDRSWDNLISVPHFECAKLYGTWLADSIRASRDVCRDHRPDTRLQPPLSERQKVLAIGARTVNAPLRKFSHGCCRRANGSLLNVPERLGFGGAPGRAARKTPVERA
jgi:hypothetical protein